MEEIKVFVSSTFKDMNQERTHLSVNIFPQFRRKCLKKGINFSWIDLRWGITDEESERGLVVPKCLESIDKCNPYFIGIIGDYYGTTLTYEEIECLNIPSDYKSKILDLVKSTSEGISITEIEILYGVLNNPSVRACFFIKESTEVKDERVKRLISRIVDSGAPHVSYTNILDLGEKVWRYVDNFLEDGEICASSLEKESMLQQGILNSYLEDIHTMDEYEKLNGKLNWITSDSQTRVAFRYESNRIHILSGEWGVGKSSYISYWISKKKSEGINFVYYFINSLSNYKSPSAISDYLVYEILKISDYSGLRETIKGIKGSERRLNFLIGYTSNVIQKPLCIVLDGVENICGESGSSGAEKLFLWMDNDPHPFVLTIYVGLYGDAAIKNLLRRFPLSCPQVISGILPSSRDTLILRVLNQYHKSLTDISKIRDCRIFDNPLLLRRFLELLISCETHNSLSETIVRFTSLSSITEFVSSYYKHISSYFQQDALIGMLKILYFSKNGLTETELMALLDYIYGYENADVSGMFTLVDNFLYREGVYRNVGNINFNFEPAKKAVSVFLENQDDILIRRSIVNILTDELSLPSYLINRVRIISEIMQQAYCLRDVDSLYKSILDAEYIIHATDSNSMIKYWAFLLDHGYSMKIYFHERYVNNLSVSDQILFYRKILGLVIFVGARRDAFDIGKAIISYTRENTLFKSYVSKELDFDKHNYLYAFLVQVCEFCAHFYFTCPSDFFELTKSLAKNDIGGGIHFYHQIRTSLLRIENLLLCCAVSENLRSDELLEKLYYLLDQHLKQIANAELPIINYSELQIMCFTCYLKIGTLLDNPLIRAGISTFTRAENWFEHAANELLSIDAMSQLRVARWRRAQAEFVIAYPGKLDCSALDFLKKSLNVLVQIDNDESLVVNEDYFKCYSLLSKVDTDINHIDYYRAMAAKYQSLVY